MSHEDYASTLNLIGGRPVQLGLEKHICEEVVRLVEAEIVLRSRRALRPLQAVRVSPMVMANAKKKGVLRALECHPRLLSDTEGPGRRR